MHSSRSSKPEIRLGPSLKWSCLVLVWLAVSVVFADESTTECEPEVSTMTEPTIQQVSRFKRQASSIQSSPMAGATAGASIGFGGNNNRRPPVQAPLGDIEIGSGARPTGQASSSTSLGGGQPSSGSGSGSSLSSSSVSSSQDGFDDPIVSEKLPEAARPSVQGSQAPKKRPKPINRRPSTSRPVEPEYNDEYCEDDDDNYGPYDYRSMFRMAAQPFQHMNNMMSRIFDRMPTNDDNYEYGDGNYAMASSSSSGDGLSRVMSSVTNNGRTRGIVSETRNGRTKTRRIGDYEENDDY